MRKFNSVDELLSYAIGREAKAAAFYAEMAAQMSKPWVAQIFKDFSLEEVGHKEKLEKIKAGKTLAPSAAKIQDLQIAEVKDEVKIGPDMDYAQALIVAMKREKAAFTLYTQLSASTDDAGLKTLFDMLAQEEAKHKLRFEIEYDEEVNKEN